MKYIRLLTFLMTSLAVLLTNVVSAELNNSYENYRAQDAKYTVDGKSNAPLLNEAAQANNDKDKDKKNEVIVTHRWEMYNESEVSSKSPQRLSNWHVSSGAVFDQSYTDVALSYNIDNARSYLLVLQAAPNFKSGKVLRVFRVMNSASNNNRKYVPSYSYSFFKYDTRQIVPEDKKDSLSIEDSKAQRLNDFLQDMIDGRTTTDGSRILLEEFKQYYNVAFGEELRRLAVPVYAGEIVDIAFIPSGAAQSDLFNFDKSEGLFKIATPANILRPNFPLNISNKSGVSTTHNRIIRVPYYQIDTLIDAGNNDSWIELFAGYIRPKNNDVMDAVPAKCTSGSQKICGFNYEDVIFQFTPQDNLDNPNVIDGLKWLEVVESEPEPELDKQIAQILYSAQITQYHAKANGFISMDIDLNRDSRGSAFSDKIPLLANVDYPLKDMDYQNIVTQHKTDKSPNTHFHVGYYIAKMSVGKAINWPSALRPPTQNLTACPLNSICLEYNILPVSELEKDNPRIISSDIVEMHNFDTPGIDSRFSITFPQEVKAKGQEYALRFRAIAPETYVNILSLDYKSDLPPSQVTKTMAIVTQYYVDTLNKFFLNSAQRIIDVLKQLVAVGATIYILFVGINFLIGSSELSLRVILSEVAKLILVLMVFNQGGTIIKSIYGASFYMIGNLMAFFQGKPWSDSVYTIDANIFGYIDNLLRYIFASDFLIRVGLTMAACIIRPGLSLIYIILMPILLMSVIRIVKQNFLMAFQVTLAYLYAYILTLLSPLFALLWLLPISKNMMKSWAYALVSRAMYPALGLIVLSTSQSVMITLIDKIVPPSKPIPLSEFIGMLLTPLISSPLVKLSSIYTNLIMGIINLITTWEMPWVDLDKFSFEQALLATFALFAYSHSISHILTKIRSLIS